MFWIIGHQSSFMNYWSIIVYELLLMNCRLSIICYELSVQLLSDLDSPPPEFRSLPSDLNTFLLSDSDKILYVDLFWDGICYVFVFCVNPPPPLDFRPSHLTSPLPSRFPSLSHPTSPLPPRFPSLSHLTSPLLLRFEHFPIVQFKWTIILNIILKYNDLEFIHMMRSNRY